MFNGMNLCSEQAANNTFKQECKLLIIIIIIQIAHGKLLLIGAVAKILTYWEGWSMHTD